MYELNRRNHEPVDVTKNWNNTAREWHEEELGTAKNVVSKVLPGQIIDPATALGNGKGAIYWETGKTLI
ncbi:MAG: hypothetical protein LBD37_05645 [Treponema sp.]|jgi:hypothetical protein|nr:hypothetical protein [Treponema sp.]